MTHTNYSCPGGRPSGARRPGPGRIATARTRTRVSSDAVVSAYIRDIARPYGREAQHLVGLHPGPAVIEGDAVVGPGAVDAAVVLASS